MKKKQMLSIMLVIMIIACPLVSMLTVQGTSGDTGILGDVNGDKIVNIRDVTEIQRILAHVITPTAAQLRRAKVTGGAELSINDATELQRYLAEFGNPWSIGEAIPDDPEGTPQMVVEKVSANPGDTNVAVSVSVKNNPGIASLAFDVHYDADALTLVNFTYNDAVISGSSTIPFNASAQPTCLSMVNGTRNVTGDWVFATLFFDVKPSASGSYAISLSYDEDNIYNIDETNVAFEVKAGEITVAGGNVPTDPTEAKDEYTVTFVDNYGNVIFQQTVKSGDAPTYPEPPAREGLVFVRWDNTVDTVTGDVVVTAIYETTTDAPTFIVDSVNARAGDTNVAVNVAVKNNPGIASILLEIIYDKNNLTLTNFAYNTDALAGSSTVPFNPDAFAPCLNMVCGTQNIQGDWVFATLYFDVKDTASGSCPITVSYDEDNVYNIDEDNVSFAVVNGAINVK